MKLISGDVILIYIENANKLADVSGVTCLAKYLSEIQINNEIFHRVNQLTGLNGEDLNPNRKMIVSNKNIISLRSPKIFEPRFYHIDYDITARDFVFVQNKSRPTERTSKFGLGSGIQGVYLKDQNMIAYLMVEENQKTYEIELNNPLYIQDREHGESITTASINHDRFIDQLLRGFISRIIENRNNINLMSDGNPFTNDILDSSKTVTNQIGYSIKNDYQEYIESIFDNIHNRFEKHILNMWKIVFDRTDFKITDEIIIDATHDFISEYINKLVDKNLDYFDSVNQSKLIEQPINFIMRRMGIDGLIAEDEFNNGWDRFCISYNFEAAKLYFGSETNYYDI